MVQFCYFCDCNSECIQLQLYIILKILLKYIVHGSHFVRYIFSNNMLQTDLKSHLRFKRYRIFRFKSRKDSFACKLLVDALWDDVASDGWLALLFLSSWAWIGAMIGSVHGCNRECTLLYFSLAVQCYDIMYLGAFCTQNAPRPTDALGPTDRSGT